VRAVKSNIAQVYHDQNRWDEAEAMYLALIDQEEDLLDPGDPQRAYALNNLGMLYHSMGRLDDAEKMLVRAHEIRRAAFGENHPIVAAGYVNVGRILRYQGRSAEAIEMFEKSLEINRSLLAADHPDIARALKELGLLYLEENRLDDAGAALEEAARIYHVAYPEGFLETAETESALGAQRLAVGDAEAAEPLLLGALSALWAGEDRNSQTTRDTLERLVRLYEARGDEQAAEKYRSQLEDLPTTSTVSGTAPSSAAGSAL
jgi:tetratricopeptide (TPR) repeat protein